MKLGAHQIVNHRNLVDECRNSGLEDFDYTVQFVDLSQHWDAMCELVAPQGKIGTIVETDDMYKQRQTLARVANLVDDRIIQTTETKVLHGLSAKMIKKSHVPIETGSTIGKLVIKY